MIPDDWRWQPDDLFRDFCQWDYIPAAPPDSETLRQASVLWHSLSLVPCGGRLQEMFHTIRHIKGPFRTVWGVKSSEQRLSWELYFYDYDRECRTVGLAALGRCLPGLLAPGITYADRWPWFMASVEFDCETIGSDRVAPVDLYFEADGGTISAGQSFIWDGLTRQMKNHYRFYRRVADRQTLRRDLVMVPPLPQDFAPGRFDEEIFVIARKRAAEGAYFSRVNAAATLEFAVKTGFHPSIVAFLEQHQAALAPFLFDTGIDYRDGILLRSAIYGVF